MHGHSRHSLLKIATSNFSRLQLRLWWQPWHNTSTAIQHLKIVRTRAQSGIMAKRLSDEVDCGDQPVRRMTRDTLSKVERERFLSMSLKEKRKLYKCESNYVTLDTVKTWSKYYKENIEGTATQKSFNTSPLKQDTYEVNETLNDKVSLWRGDITKLEVDGIVNAANKSLMGGGGVDGAIHSAAGKLLKQECMTLGGCDTGDAKVTAGYNLPAKYVLHTVGPIGEHANQLQSCYSKCLHHMSQHSLTSIAFPCISTGIYGYPNEKAAIVALETIRRFLQDDPYSDKVERIVLCLFMSVDVDLYEHYMQLYFPTATSGQS